LRERGGDLVLLIHLFLHRFSHELGLSTNAISQEAVDRLRRYHWPGNVRELRSVLKQALLKASGEDKPRRRRKCAPTP
jgi:transcriptional regulator with GAF, ATPase, and Fis domain